MISTTPPPVALLHHRLNLQTSREFTPKLSCIACFKECVSHAHSTYGLTPLSYIILSMQSYLFLRRPASVVLTTRQMVSIISTNFLVLCSSNF